MAKARYYEPPKAIASTEGIKVRHTAFTDDYTGTAEALIEAGLLRADQFPGQPGMPTVSVAYRPHGARSWGPGYMQVFRNPGDTFRISIKVPDEERERRRSEAEKRTAGARPASPSHGRRWTLDGITNRRVEPGGLIVENYLPRFQRYEGTAKQMVEAGVLPRGFKGFPKPTEPGKSWCSTRWEEGNLSYRLSKKYVSGKACKLEDASADYWEFEIFDDRYSFADYLERRPA